MSGKTISEEQEKIICDTLQENSKILLEIKFTPENLFKLIESNTKFASEIYLRISKAEFFKDYLEIFLTKSSSVYSLEVMNRIIQFVELPREFIYKFIQNLILSKKPDKQKNRSVRIIAIFISNLIENDHFSFEDEIPDFLDEFLKENGKEKEVEGLIQKLNIKK